MNEERIKSIMILLAIATIICNLAIEADLRNKNDELQYQYNILGMQLDRFKMYYNETYGEAYNFKNDSLVAGIAYGDYITVWTQDKTITEVLEVCAHEYAHNNLMMEDLQ